MQTAGYLMPIGGAEKKDSQRTVLEQFVNLAGGPHSRVLIIPTASTNPVEAAQRYQQLFREMGCSAVEPLIITDRCQANETQSLDLFDDVTGIFLTGGDQVKLLSVLGGTPIVERLIDSWTGGATIAGTSAGASALSKHMIAFGRGGSVPSHRMVQLAPGLGLAEKIIIDQHFRQRNRIGRLMTAVAFNPGLIGMGLDEDTACVIGPNAVCRVVGSGTMTIVDASNLASTDIYSVKGRDPIALLGMQVHVLKAGYGFHLGTRDAFPLG